MRPNQSTVRPEMDQAIQPDDTIELNKRLALRTMRMIEDGDDRLADELIHPDYHNHEAAADRPGGPEGFKETARMFRRAFAEIHFDPQGVIAEADKVVVRGQFSAHHVGPFAGMPVTGRELSVQHIHVWRVMDDKIIEHWAVRDDARAMRQLGLLQIGVSP